MINVPFILNTSRTFLDLIKNSNNRTFIPSEILDKIIHILEVELKERDLKNKHENF